MSMLPWNCLLRVSTTSCWPSSVQQREGRSSPHTKGDGTVQLLSPHILVSLYDVPCMGMIGMFVSVARISLCIYTLYTKANSLAALQLITVIQSVVSSVTLLSKNLSTLKLKLHRRMVCWKLRYQCPYNGLTCYYVQFRCFVQGIYTL